MTTSLTHSSLYKRLHFQLCFKLIYQDYSKRLPQATCSPTQPGIAITKLTPHQEELSSTLNIDDKDADGNTPLHVAASFGRDEACEWLMERGRAVFEINGQGDSPAILAKRAGFESLALRLDAKATETARREDSRVFSAERESLFYELDKKNAALNQLRASERRLRAELDAETNLRLRSCS